VVVLTDSVKYSGRRGLEEAYGRIPREPPMISRHSWINQDTCYANMYYGCVMNIYKITLTFAKNSKLLESVIFTNYGFLGLGLFAIGQWL